MQGAITDTSGDNASDGQQDYLKYAMDTGNLYYDGNGTAAGGLQQIATLYSDGATPAVLSFDPAQDIVLV